MTLWREKNCQNNLKPFPSTSDETRHFTELRMDGDVMYWTFFRWATLGPFYCLIHYLKFSAFDILYVVESVLRLIKDMSEENPKAVHRVYSSWYWEWKTVCNWCGPLNIVDQIFLESGHRHLLIKYAETPLPSFSKLIWRQYLFATKIVNYTDWILNCFDPFTVGCHNLIIFVISVWRGAPVSVRACPQRG